MRYTISDFKKDFYDDRVCLDYIFNNRFNGKKTVCKRCGRQGNFSLVNKHKKYACSWCGKQISPTAGTIFNKSKTPLTKWFHAIFIMSQYNNKVSAKELERRISVSYETAQRIKHEITKLIQNKKNIF